MEDIFEEVKQCVSLAHVVSGYGVGLKPRGGGRLAGLCPFHREKTGSFTVYPDNRYHCFGCGEDGDAIDFVQKMDGIPPLDAVRQLAGEYGIPIDGREADRGEIEKRQRQKEIVREFDRCLDAIYDTLCRLRKRAVWDFMDYAPKTPDEWGKQHPRFVAACYEREYLEYLLDYFTDAEPREKIEIYKRLKKFEEFKTLGRGICHRELEEKGRNN